MGQPQVALKDLVLALLASAAAQGRTRIPLTQFFLILSELAGQPAFPATVPPLRFMRSGRLAYSKRVDEALQSLIGYSVKLPNPSLQCLEIDRTSAQRLWQHLTLKYPSNPFQEVAGEFIKALKESERSADGCR